MFLYAAQRLFVFFKNQLALFLEDKSLSFALGIKVFQNRYSVVCTTYLPTNLPICYNAPVFTLTVLCLFSGSTSRVMGPNGSKQLACFS